MSDDATPDRAAKLARLVEHWRDSAQKVKGYDSDVGTVLLRCAWELETILEGKDA